MQVALHRHDTYFWLDNGLCILMRSSRSMKKINFQILNDLNFTDVDQKKFPIIKILNKYPNLMEIINITDGKYKIKWNNFKDLESEKRLVEDMNQ